MKRSKHRRHSRKLSNRHASRKLTRRSIRLSKKKRRSLRKISLTAKRLNLSFLKKNIPSSLESIKDQYKNELETIGKKMGDTVKRSSEIGKEIAILSSKVKLKKELEKKLREQADALGPEIEALSKELKEKEELIREIYKENSILGDEYGKVEKERDHKEQA